MTTLAQTLAALGDGRRTYVTSCTVTSVSPLTVTVDGTSMRGVAVAGLPYDLGSAVALWSPPALPIIFPTV